MSDDMEPVTGTVAAMRPADKYRLYMKQRAEIENKDAGAMVMDTQVDNILTAETDEEVWDADLAGTIQARDVPGLEVRIHDLRPVESARDDIVSRTGYYASMNCTVLGGPADMLTRNGLALGQDCVLQTGAELIISKVRVFEARDKLPIDAVITAIKTASGNDVLKIRPLPARVMPGTAE
jgi:hypothetical protein